LCLAQKQELRLGAIGSVEFKTGGTGEAGRKKIDVEGGPITKVMLSVESEAQEGNKV
jgi:hypothetical protein